MRSNCRESGSPGVIEGLIESESYFTVPTEGTRRVHRTAVGEDADAREKVTKEATVLIIGVRVPYNADKRRSHRQMQKIRHDASARTRAHRLDLPLIRPGSNFYPFSSKRSSRANPPRASMMLLREEKGHGTLSG